MILFEIFYQYTYSVASMILKTKKEIVGELNNGLFFGIWFKCVRFLLLSLQKSVALCISITPGVNACGIMVSQQDKFRCKLVASKYLARVSASRE